MVKIIEMLRDVSDKNVFLELVKGNQVVVLRNQISKTARNGTIIIIIRIRIRIITD